MQIHSRSTHWRFITIVIVLLLIVSNTWAGTSGKIAGRFYDEETGEALPGANVMIEGTNLGSSSDIDGRYFIINVPPGIYVLKASYMGHEGMVINDVYVTIDRTTEIDFPMTANVLEGVEVTITAERPLVDKDLTASRQVVSADDMDQSWARDLTEVVEMQSGVSDGHFRGGTMTESVYLLDNISLNSGLMSDNYTGVNPTTIEEVVVLTGGYNAEYGNAQSGIVNAITREVTSGYEATLVTRMRPAGKYHWGRNLYSDDNADIADYGLDYWADQVADPDGDFYEGDADALLAQYQGYTTADDVLKNYAERAEYETEATIVGALTPKIGYMFSGRFKRGVNVYPQILEYNPEHNIQGKISYKVSDQSKLTFSVLVGGYETADYSPSNFNSLENAQGMAWTAGSMITDPYSSNKYAMLASWSTWPEIRNVSSYSLNWTQTLSPNTYFELWGSLLSDDMDKTDRDNLAVDSLWSFDNDEWEPLTWNFQVQPRDADGNPITGRHWGDKYTAKVTSFGGSVSSQVNDNHLVRSGFEYKLYDMDFETTMSAYEGGARWNLMNVYSGKPSEGAAYVQDKMEFGGLIMNAGLRLDFFNQNRDAAANMFDPLAFEETTPGNVTPGLPGDPETEATEMQVALAPRLGFSHPITEKTVLHFMYGHFYQRPSWHKMLSFAYINFAEDDITNPYNPDHETYMDQWQGYQGNPKMGYEKTVQYEIGFDQNIADKFSLDVTAFYKDASRQTTFREATFNDPRWGEEGRTPQTFLYSMENQYNIAIMSNNGAYADVRGIETGLASNFKSPFNFNIGYDLSFSTGGVSGLYNMFEGDGIDARHGYEMTRKAWNNNHKIKAMVNMDLHDKWGPSIAGFKPLADFHTNIYWEYRNGDQYTYHAPDDQSTKPNNMRWFAHYRTNLKVSKGIGLMGLHAELSMEVRNLFNDKDLNMPWDMDKYHNKTELTAEEELEGLTLEEAKLNTHWYDGRFDQWGAYNQWTNPPRQVFLQLRLDI